MQEERDTQADAARRGTYGTIFLPRASLRSNNHAITMGDLIYAVRRHGLEIDIVPRETFAERYFQQGQ